MAAIPYGPAAAVLAIADGAGGMPGGRRASETAIKELKALDKEAVKAKALALAKIFDKDILQKLDQ